MSLINKLRQIIKPKAKSDTTKPETKEPKKLETVSDYEEYIDKEFKQCDKVVSNHGNHQGRSYLNPAGAQVAMIQLRTALNKIPTQAGTSCEEMNKLRTSSEARFNQLYKVYQRFNKIPIAEHSQEQQN